MKFFPLSPLKQGLEQRCFLSLLAKDKSVAFGKVDSSSRSDNKPNGFWDRINLKKKRYVRLYIFNVQNPHLRKIIIQYFSPHHALSQIDSNNLGCHQNPSSPNQCHLEYIPK